MSTVLAYTSPARGHLFPLTPVLLELQRRGHRIVLKTLGSEVLRMRELGFDAAPIDPVIEGIQSTDFSVTGARAALAETVRVFCERARHDAPDLRAAIEQTSPDVLIVDVNTWGAMAEAERWGGPWSLFSPYTLPISSRDAPPFGPGLAPARGPLGRVRDAVVRPLVMGAAERTMRPPLNDVRSMVGVPPLRTADDMFRRAPLTLLTTAEPFEYPRTDWPESVVLMGPSVWEPPAPAPAWLDGISDPIVLVTTSSEYQDDGRLVRVALEALKDEPVHVVATLPAGIRESYDVPANAHVEEFVAHGPVLERAVCAVTHGGMGSTQKALARGIPVCVVPFGRDQHEVARRVVVADCGTSLSIRKLDAPRLRARVREAMTKGDGVRRVVAGYEATGGPATGADAVESRLLGVETRATG